VLPTSGRRPASATSGARQPVDAIVLVGGQGTRLRPLTWTRHKSLVPLCNRPFIEYVFDWLRSSGFERVVLALGRNNEDLATAYPAGRYPGFDLAIVLEQERLESGGAIRNAVAAAGVKGRFVVLNGDVFVDFDFARALAAHVEVGADLTLALCEVDDPSVFGVAVVDESRMVTGFVEKPPPGTAPSRLANAGVWIFEPGLVAEIPPGAVRVEETLFPSLVARKRRVLGYRFQGLWADIGVHSRYLALDQALLERRGGPALAAGAEIEASARVVLSSVGAGSTIGVGATVERSLLWERVRVGSGAEVLDSIVADGVSIGVGARVLGAVIGSEATISGGAVLEPGTLVEPGARYDGL
jgi:mannose-1-phosphate guanylyltransferase